MATINEVITKLKEKNNKMKYTINDFNKINDKIINDDIFSQEKVDYVIRERETLIDDLIDWISEATEDKAMMKEDLIYLISLKDKYLLSSILTNEYIQEDTEEGQEILEEIYNL